MNWIFNGQDPESPPGPCRRRWLPLTAIGAVALTGCGDILATPQERPVDRLVARADYSQDPRTGVCVMKVGDGNAMTVAPVDCTEAVLNLIESQRNP